MPFTNLTGPETVETTRGDATVIVREMPEGDYEGQLTVRLDGDDAPDEQWTIGVSENREVEVITTNAVDDVFGEITMPAWLEALLRRDFGLEVSG